MTAGSFLGDTNHYRDGLPGQRACLAAPFMALTERAPALAPWGAPVTTTHRVISYTYPSTLPRTSSGQATASIA
jgi:hypothetical protein